jgi:hypothetical protein
MAWAGLSRGKGGPKSSPKHSNGEKNHEWTPINTNPADGTARASFSLLCIGKFFLTGDDHDPELLVFIRVNSWFQIRLGEDQGRTMMKHF